jgi:hypothetical protein
MKTTPATKEEVIKFCSNPQLVNYYCFISRPGIYAWMVEVEYTKFKPDTPANDGYHLLFSEYPEKKPIPELTMMIMSIDKSGQEFAESILWKHGLKRCRAGMVAMVIDSKGPHEFFLQGPNVFCLENHNKGAENVIYKNDPEKMAKAREHEMEQVRKFFDEHKKWIESPEGKIIAEAYWKKNPTGYVR